MSGTKSLVRLVANKLLRVSAVKIMAREMRASAFSLGQHAVLRIPFGNSEEGRAVDALTEEGDEGRSLAAIRFGEVPSNLRSGDFRMG